MGSLRFRRSVSISKGVRLNFGKKGVSISSGIPGFRKTYNFNTGKTTTSVGIPGTGVYYVDTSGPSKKKEEKKSGGLFSDLFGGNQSSSSTVPHNANSYSNNNASQERATAKPAEPVYPVHEDTTVHPTNASSKVTTPKKKSEPVDTVVEVSEHRHTTLASVVDETIMAPTVEPVSVSIPVEEKKPEKNTYDTIKAIFENCDVAIDWVDVIAHRAPTSDDVVPETWEYLHKKAVDVFDGNIDTFLEIISTVNPYDDLLDYAENFEFGTDDASMMEIEFSVIDANVGNLSKSAFEDYYSAIAIRVARDTFALLPIEKVVVHLIYKYKELLTAAFVRDSFNKLNLTGKDASDILKQLVKQFTKH